MHVALSKSQYHLCGLAPETTYVVLSKLIGLLRFNLINTRLRGPSGLFVSLRAKKSKPAAGKLPRQGVSPSAFCSMEKHTMKTLIIVAMLVVGGIQLGFNAYDSAVASVQQTETAKNIKARQVL